MLSEALAKYADLIQQGLKPSEAREHVALMYGVVIRPGCR